MTAYIALLRGVNVSGKNKLPMADFRTALEATPLVHIKTYIQSGNLYFETDLAPSDAEAYIAQVLKTNFDIEVPVIIKTQSAIMKALAANPYAARTLEEPKYMSFGFLKAVPEEKTIGKLIEAKSTPIESFTIIEDVLYFYCGVGFGKTKLTNAFFEKHLGVACTMRNYKTTLKLTQL